MDVIIYALSSGLLLSCLVDMGCRSSEKRFSVGIIRSLLIIPWIGLLQFCIGMDLSAARIAPLFFSENVFALSWMLLAFNLHPLAAPATGKYRLYRMAPLVVVVAGLGAGGFWIYSRPVFQISESSLTFPHFGSLYISSLVVLVSMLIMAWRLESFWRCLSRKTRIAYKYLVIGYFLITGSMGWSTSFRLTALRLKSDHLLLLSLLLFLGWLFAVYAAAGNRLLNRKIFVSRKIVYSSLAPLIFAVYLIGVGLISLLMRTFGWSIHFVLQWLLIVTGLLLLAVFALSTRVRARIRYFISTHFYVNKYEYRDQWLSFSNLLHRELSERGVVDALRHILSDSLYTHRIIIWIGDEKTGYPMAFSSTTGHDNQKTAIAAEDPLIAYLQSASCLNRQAPAADTATDRILSEKEWFFESLGLVLMAPIAIGGHFVGIIGLGPEYTGGRYGKDDFDLLAAISSQAASALLAVRTAEELARAREQSAWNVLSTFVLHDIKNAATMLSLIQKNAPRHIQNPEFQEDMLASVDDALKRMNKIQARLNTLKGDIEPDIRTVNAGQLLREICTRIGRKLPQVQINIDCPPNQPIQTDPDFLGIILENLVLNAMEAGSGQTTSVRVQIRLGMTDYCGFQIECADNGPGVSPELLPNRLFEPFITGKPKGSGIGLWQVKRLVESLGGSITAQNRNSGGARFLQIYR